MLPDDSDRDDLDRAIDAVARTVTEGRPSAAFSARVRARLEPPRRRTAGWWLVPVSAAAALLMLVQQRQPAMPLLPSSSYSFAVMAPIGSAAYVDDAVTLPSTPRCDRAAAALPPATADVAADMTLIPLTVTAVDAGAMSPANSMTLSPLDPIAPISLAPIDEGDRP